MIILETAVRHARVGRHGVGWEGARTQQAHACKDEQRTQPAAGRLNRVCSALTKRVDSVVAKNISIHADLQRKTSGQLRLPGSTLVAAAPQGGEPAGSMTQGGRRLVTLDVRALLARGPWTAAGF